MNLNREKNTPSFRKSIEINKGINRFIWPFKLKRTEEELINYRDKFVGIKESFKEIVVDQERIKFL